MKGAQVVRHLEKGVPKKPTPTVNIKDAPKFPCHMNPTWAGSIRMIPNEKTEDYELVGNTSEPPFINCKKCGFHFISTFPDLETHCKENHNLTPPSSPPLEVIKRKRSFENLDRHMEEKAKALADTPEFFLTFKDHPAMQEAIQKKAKALLENKEFVLKYEKDHPEIFDEPAKKQAEERILNYIKSKFFN